MARVVVLLLALAVCAQLTKGEPNDLEVEDKLLEGTLSHEDLHVTPFMFSRSHRPLSHAITLVTHMDVGRLWQLEQVARYWDGPINVAVLFGPDEQDEVLKLLKVSSKVFRRHVTIHAVQATKSWDRYPMNIMRNIGMQGVQTDWLLVLDGDELPVVGMAAVKDELVRVSVSTPQDKTLYVLTSFQWNTRKLDRIPTTLDELQHLYNNGDAVCKINSFPISYTPPGMTLPQWLAMSHARQVVYTDRYEPYFVVRTTSSIKFDERFHGLGGDKITGLMKLAANGYYFVVLPHAFTFTDENMEDSSYFRLENEPFTQRVYREIGEMHGCTDCTKERCTIDCPGLVQPLIE